MDIAVVARDGRLEVVAVAKDSRLELLEFVVGVEGAVARGDCLEVATARDGRLAIAVARDDCLEVADEVASTGDS